MKLVAPNPDRIYVGYFPEAERRRFSRAGRGATDSRARKRIDRAGPVFLFLLLSSAFVPSLLTEFDVARLLRIVQEAVIALMQPSPCFVSGEQRRSDSPTDLACSSGGCQVADSAAVVFDGRGLAAAAPSSVVRRRGLALRKRRFRGPHSPRAPPALRTRYSFPDGI